MEKEGLVDKFKRCIMIKTFINYLSLIISKKDQQSLQYEKRQVQLEDDRRMRQALGLEPKNNDDLPNLNQYEMDEVIYNRRGGGLKIIYY